MTEGAYSASPSARKVVTIFLGLPLITFISFGFHLVSLDVSAFPGGYMKDGHYFVGNHGKVIELTRSEFILSYVHGCLMVGTILLYFGVVAYFHWKGDLKRQPLRTEPIMGFPVYQVYHARITP